MKYCPTNKPLENFAWYYEKFKLHAISKNADYEDLFPSTPFSSRV